MDKVKGLEVLIEVVANNKTHQDYARVTNLAIKYFMMDSGEKLETLLEQVITRETDEEIIQRRRITKSVIPAIINSTKLPFEKVTRNEPRVRKIDFTENAETKKQELEDYISKYWGDKSLEKFLEYAFIEYNYTDPNAFLITEFESFNNLKEKASPYPFVATSEEAIMFEYQNEILDYLIVKLPIFYLDKGTPQPGFKFTMYLGMDTIELTQVAEEIKNDPSFKVFEIEKKFYSVIYFQPKNEKVPAIRFGFKRDTVTKGRTFISLFHPVLCYLEKTLKIDSELDLSCAMTAFPQRFAYVSPCKNKGCNKGQLLDGSGICPDCHGTGKQEFHRGVMDIVTLELPKDPADMIDLEQMMAYKTPPIELLTFQKDYIESLKKSTHAMMFNADLFTRDQVTITATEKGIESDNMNDTLRPFGEHYSAVWKFTVKDIATFTDMNNGLEVEHKFNKDFKQKGLLQYAIELKALKDAQASTSTITAVEDDINEILYSDRPDELKKMRIKNSVNPFRGYSETDIRFIITMDNIPLEKRTLWENLESIFQDLEMENQKPWLYDLAEIKIKDLVKVKTQEYIDTIKAETPAPITQPFLNNLTQPKTGAAQQ